MAPECEASIGLKSTSMLKTSLIKLCEKVILASVWTKSRFAGVEHHVT